MRPVIENAPIMARGRLLVSETNPSGAIATATRICPRITCVVNLLNVQRDISNSLISSAVFLPAQGIFADDNKTYACKSINLKPKILL